MRGPPGQLHAEHRESNTQLQLRRHSILPVFETSLETLRETPHLGSQPIAAIEEADAVLLVGTNPRLEAPLVNTRCAEPEPEP